MIELLKEALETIKTLKEYCESDDPGLEIGVPVIAKLEEAITNGTWRGLTDEEIAEVRHLYDWSAGWTFERFARQIEAKLKEKNT